MANRAQRRAMEKAEKKYGNSAEIAPLSDNGKQWIDFGKEHNVDFNAFFIMFSGFLNLPRRDKESVVVELVSQGLVDIDDNSRSGKSDEWEKVNKENTDAEEQGSEGI